MATLIILGIILLAINFFLQALVLHFLTRLFKLHEARYKKALVATGLQWIATIVTSLLLAGIFYLVGTESFRDLLIWVIGFVAFHFILQRYYKSNLGKNVALYLLISIAIIIISFVLILSVRNFVVQPVYMSGSSMEPAVQDGEYMLFTMFNKTYVKDDIIVLRSPASKSLLIRKISGLPGEKIQLPSGQSIELKGDEYFIVAENQSGEVQDSYDFGAIKSSAIIGKYWFSPNWFNI